MNFYPEKEEIKKYSVSGEYDIAPITLEIYSDLTTPIASVMNLKKISSHVFMLESVQKNESWGRYTFLGFDPKMDITCIDGKLTIQEGDSEKTIETTEPSDYIREILRNYRSPKIPGLPSFTGGFVGYFSYDFVFYSEPSMKGEVTDDEEFKDFDLMLFDTVIAFDALHQKIILITNVNLKGDIDKEYELACERLLSLKSILSRTDVDVEPAGVLLGEPEPLFSEEQFCQMVERAKEYIREGDIFQVVLSNRLTAPFSGSLLNTYRVLRTINPSPYMFYFSGTDVEVAGASPETLVRLSDGVLSTFPLAGTRPRGANRKEDFELELELLSDEKELAEHNMLVDLGRNDLGKISKFGTVEVEALHEIVRFSHVMHIGSTVRGEIAEGFDALDAINAVLPAGTLSGAPKIRASQIIAELEGNKRGIYGGAVGYIDFTGNMDTCIAIRLAYKKNGKVFARSGAGIVADSVPLTEFKETINKAAAVVNALKKAGEVE